MKRKLLVVISVVLVLASVFGFYAAYAGLKDIPGIKRNKNLQAADIEDAIDLIEENLDDYNKMVKLQNELDADKQGTQDSGMSASEAPAATVQNPAARAYFGKPQRSLASPEAEAEYSSAFQNFKDCQAAYDSAEKAVNQSQANYDAAQQSLNNSQARANAISGSISTANSAYSEYLAAQAANDMNAMNSALARYQSAISGYPTVREMESALAAANQSVEADRARVSAASAALSADQQAFNNAKNNLNSANTRLSNAKNNLGVSGSVTYTSNGNLYTYTPSNNSNGNTSNSNSGSNSSSNSNTRNTNNSGNQNASSNSGSPIFNILPPPPRQNISDEEADKLKKDVEETADKLAELQEYDDVKAIVENGIKILLDNDEIASRVTDEKDLEAVIDAARDYLSETTKSVNRELTTRQQLYFALRILSIVGAIAGILGILVAVTPKSFLFTMTLLMSAFTALGAVALNVYGYVFDYLNFVYTRVNGDGDGKLQLYSLIAMLVAALLSIIIVALCRKSFKKALKKRKIREHLLQETKKAEERRAEKSTYYPDITE